ncbi:hypothetical protein [Hyperthermus butylicus]|uniref:hypothetical protein n=1 Tax=Hyperthermus butylicus TaxID=54248 RepID=UPI00064EB083|nr:hypothetical protein [Hyperthermus butylicus]
MQLEAALIGCAAELCVGRPLLPAFRPICICWEWRRSLVINAIYALDGVIHEYLDEVKAATSKRVRRTSCEMLSSHGGEPGILARDVEYC